MSEAIKAAEAMREAIYAKMPSYGKINWDELVGAVGAASGATWTPDDTHYVGHQMPTINVNSLNRIVTYFVERKPEAKPDPRDDALAKAREAIAYANRFFEAAISEGLIDALADNSGEAIHDLWSRRLSFARDKFPSALAALAAAKGAG